MSSADDLPPLDPELTSLFAEERARPEPAADAAKARVLSRLQASTSAAAPGLAAKLGPLLVALAVGGALGAGLTAKLQEPTIVYVDRPVAAPPVESVAVPAIRHVVEESAPSASSPPARVASGAVDTLARERALLDEARASLAKGDASAALAATDRHSKEFPRGQMAEEREALAIQSMAKLGRVADARERAADFKTRYPNSVLGPVVDSVTNPPAEPK
jgi:hypothetical protein